MVEIILRVTNRATKTNFYLTQTSDDHTLSRRLCLCRFAGFLCTAGCTLRLRLNVITLHLTVSTLLHGLTNLNELILPKPKDHGTESTSGWFQPS